MVSLLLDEHGADDIARELGSAESLTISVLTVAEVLDVLRRVHRVPVDEADDTIERFLLGVDAVDVTREIAAGAADVRARHYHRRDRDVSLADCVAVATARPGDVIATSDGALARVGRADGFEVLALPNSHGRRPAP